MSCVELHFNNICPFRIRSVIFKRISELMSYQSTLLPVKGQQVPRQIFRMPFNEEFQLSHAPCGSPIFEVFLNQSLNSSLAIFDENNVFGLGDGEGNYLFPRKPGCLHPHCG
jgi:hypothetical protein